MLPHLLQFSHSFLPLFFVSRFTQQRMEKKKLDKGERTSMTTDRKARLESIGFKWAKAKGQANWDMRFKELKAFKKEFGHCNVPTKPKDLKYKGMRSSCLSRFGAHRTLTCQHTRSPWEVGNEPEVRQEDGQANQFQRKEVGEDWIYLESVRAELGFYGCGRATML